MWEIKSIKMQGVEKLEYIQAIQEPALFILFNDYLGHLYIFCVNDFSRNFYNMNITSEDLINKYVNNRLVLHY